MNLIFEVFCQSCGSNLSIYKTVLKNDTDRIIIYAEPCADCVDTAQEEGRAEGHQLGFDEGLEEAKNQ